MGHQALTGGRTEDWFADNQRELTVACLRTLPSARQLAETSHTWIEWSALQLLQNTPLHPIAEWGRLRFETDMPAEQRVADLENTLR